MGDVKEYNVYIDVVISLSLSVNAKSEEEAKKKAKMEVSLDPMYHAYHRGDHVSIDIVDVEEED